MEKNRRFPQDQYKILMYLGNIQQKVSFEVLIESLKMDQVFISSGVQTLNLFHLVEVEEQKFNELKLGKNGLLFKETGLPEKIIIRALEKGGGKLSISEICQATGLEQKVVGQNINVMSDKGWIIKEQANLNLTNSGKTAINIDSNEDKLFELLRTSDFLILEEIFTKYSFAKEGYELLSKRAQLVQLKERTKRYVKLSTEGELLLKEGIEEKIEVTQLTSELLSEGKWKEVDFKPYDVKTDTATIYPGKIHPYQAILNETRRVFIEMGFTETESPHVELAFWDFDALFQPQDHPARDMQDTFYMKRPKEANLTEQKLVDAVKNTHENGGTSGSLGWRYKWDLDKAKNIVLRTHTTAASIRYLEANPEPPLKVFCIGKVFRRETIDFKHLPVFTQVDGIISETNASLAQLIGLLKEFYKKMGFAKIDVRPAFFPYTEPSLEIFVFLEDRKEWVEMGGAGIFRKEVTEPIGCNSPVLAWGLGLERLAMFKYNLSDIRDIYIADVKWLREEKTCQL